jgi:hypothetical protein
LGGSKYFLQFENFFSWLFLDSLPHTTANSCTSDIKY